MQLDYVKFAAWHIVKCALNTWWVRFVVFQMLVAWVILLVLNNCKRNPNAHWKSIAGVITPINPLVLASSCWDCHRWGQFHLKWLNNSFLYDWWARPLLRPSSEICYCRAIHSSGPRHLHLRCLKQIIYLHHLHPLLPLPQLCIICLHLLILCKESYFSELWVSRPKNKNL